MQGRGCSADHGRTSLEAVPGFVPTTRLYRMRRSVPCPLESLAGQGFRGTRYNLLVVNSPVRYRTFTSLMPTEEHPFTL